MRRSWSSVSSTVKPDLSFASSAWRRRICAETEWKVPNQRRPSPSGPTRASVRSRISRAALLVKVTTSICARPGAARGEDVGDARRQHARLAGAGAGEDEQRAFGGEHRLALFGVEALSGSRRWDRRRAAGARRRAGRWGACRSRFGFAAMALFGKRRLPRLFVGQLVEFQRRRAAFRNRLVVVRTGLAADGFVGREGDVCRIAGFVHSALIWRGFLLCATLPRQNLDSRCVLRQPRDAGKGED